MPYLLNCPGCGTRLRVRDDAAEQRFTCPRCLAAVGPAGQADEAILTALPGDPGVAPRPRSTPAGFRVADVDVRRDTGSTSVGLGLLGILLLVAVALTFASGYVTGQGFMRSSSSSETTGLLLTLGLLAAGFVTLIAPVPIMVRLLRGRDVGAGRIVLGIVLYFVILGTTVIALIVLFFVACLAGLGSR